MYICWKEKDLVNCQWTQEVEISILLMVPIQERLCGVCQYLIKPTQHPDRSLYLISQRFKRWIQTVSVYLILRNERTENKLIRRKNITLNQCFRHCFYCKWSSYFSTRLWVIQAKKKQIQNRYKSCRKNKGEHSTNESRARWKRHVKFWMS